MAEGPSSALWWLFWSLLGPGQALSFPQRTPLQPLSASTWIPTASTLDIKGCFLLEEDAVHRLCHGALSLSLIGNKEGSESPVLPSYLLQTYCIKLSVYQICKASEMYSALHFSKTWYGT